MVKIVSFLNETGLIGQIITAFTTNVTGSEPLTFISFVVIMIAAMSVFNIPLEFQTLFMVPFVLVLMAMSSTFLVMGGVFLCFVAVTLAKLWFF